MTTTLLYPPTFDPAVEENDLAFTHALLAVHEAGHAACLEGLGKSVDAAEIHRGGDGGHHGEVSSNSIAVPQEHVLIALAGKVAECMWLEQLTPHGLPSEYYQRASSNLSGGDRAKLESQWQASGYTDLIDARADVTTLLKRHWSRVLAYAADYVHLCPCSTTPKPPPAASSSEEHRPDADGLDDFALLTPDPVPTPAPTTTGGITAMSGIEEVRAALSMSTERAQEAISALMQAGELMSQVRETVAQVTQSSNAEEVAQAYAQFGQVEDGLREQSGQIRGALEALETYQARL